MKKLSLILGSGMLTVMLGIAPLSALANDNNSDKGSMVIRPHVAVSQSVQVNNNGAVTLRGTVGGVSSASLVVKSWGGDWTVSVGSATKIVSRSSTAIALADIKVGDFVAVHGTMKTNAGLSIDAKQVKDQFVPDRSATLRGTITSIGVSTLTVKSGDTTWTVNVTPTTKLSSKFAIATTLGAMKVGDAVVVTGTVSAGATTTMSATEVKDLSLPLNAVVRTGTIANVAGNIFTLLGKKNQQDIKVTTDANTAVTVNGKSGTNADIKNDSRATVQGVLNADTSVLSAVKVMIGNFKSHDDKDKNNGRR